MDKIGAGMTESCGIFGCILSENTFPETFDVAECVYGGLNSLQHRGSESSGMVGAGTASEQFQMLKGHGLAKNVFSDQEKLSKFSGCVVCIGHNRYSTAGTKGAASSVQPYVLETLSGWIAVAHNGQLIDAEQKRREIKHRGLPLGNDNDSELISVLICDAMARRHSAVREEMNVQGGCCPLTDCGGDLKEHLLDVMKELTLSYSLLVMTKDRVFAIRDPWGNRPLCLGAVKGSDGVRAWIVSSETCGLFPIGGEFLREVSPGEVVEITRKGVQPSSIILRRPGWSPNPGLCIFEYVYFARRDSSMEGQQVESVRRRCGMELAKEWPVEADIVSTVPSSATPAALGYAKQCGIEYAEVLCKNSHSGRSFIQPNEKARQTAVRYKFGPLFESFRNKRVVIVDDSIVRGNTMGPIVRLLKDYGAKEVHIRVASPPIRYPCYMGINIPTRQELIAHRMTIEEMEAHFHADSVRYLSVEGLKLAVEEGIDRSRYPEVGHCIGCLKGSYPVNLPLGLVFQGF